MTVARIRSGNAAHDGAIVGGFTSVAWSSGTTMHRVDTTAFLFGNARHKKATATATLERYPLLENCAARAVARYREAGPVFGGDDLFLLYQSRFSPPNNAKHGCGTYNPAYSVDGTVAGVPEFKVAEIEIFAV